MPALSPEEVALFDAVTTDPDDPFADFEASAPKAAPAPAPSAPSRKLTIKEVENAPKCMSCGVELNAENGSKNRGGEWKHIDCPAVIPTPTPATTAPAAVLPPDAPANSASAPAPVKRGRKPAETRTPLPGVPGATIVATPFPSQSGVVELGPETLAFFRALFGK